MHHLALMTPATPLASMTDTGAPPYHALLQELRRLGYAQGQNPIVERHFGGRQKDRYPDLVRAVVTSHPDVIFTVTARLVGVFKAETTKIPIVCYVSDPAAHGIVPNVVRPSGSITGIVADAGLEMEGKFIEILQAIRLPRAALLNGKVRLANRDAAEKLGISLVEAMLDNFDEPNYRRSFSQFTGAYVDALLISTENENFAYRELIVRLAAEHAIPALYRDKIFVKFGGLISYGFESPALYRNAAVRIDKILKGTNPGELPMEPPTKFELVINLKTKTLGLEISASLLARANEVIE